MMRLSTRAWCWLFGAYAYLATTLSAAWFLRRMWAENGRTLGLGTSILWSGLLYAGWIPVMGAIWLVYRRLGPRPQTYLGLAALGLLAIPGHALFSVWLDGLFSGEGPRHFARHVEHRLPVAILIYSALAAAGLAIVLLARNDELTRALAAARQAAGRAEATPGPSRLMVSAGSRRVLVDPAEVDWFGAAGNYVVVHWDAREGLIRETLQAVADRLDPAVFARCHRSAIANLARVSTAAALSDGSWRLTTVSGEEIVVSRTYRDAILRRLGR